LKCDETYAMEKKKGKSKIVIRLLGRSDDSFTDDCFLKCHSNKTLQLEEEKAKLMSDKQHGGAGDKSALYLVRGCIMLEPQRCDARKKGHELKPSHTAAAVARRLDDALTDDQHESCLRKYVFGARMKSREPRNDYYRKVVCDDSLWDRKYNEDVRFPQIGSTVQHEPNNRREQAEEAQVKYNFTKKKPLSKQEQVKRAKDTIPNIRRRPFFNLK